MMLLYRTGTMVAVMKEVTARYLIQAEDLRKYYFMPAIQLVVLIAYLSNTTLQIVVEVCSVS